MLVKYRRILRAFPYFLAIILFLVTTGIILQAGLVMFRTAPNSDYTYQVINQAKAEDAVILDFKQTIRRTLGDSRGWQQSGIEFKEVKEKPSLTIMLASSGMLREYPDCSEEYSCEVGNTVLINVDRWQGGNPRWNGGLTSYRTLVINHEVGHFLGFGHSKWTLPFNEIPVMRSQASGLFTAKTDIWPSHAEINTLRRDLQKLNRV